MLRLTFLTLALLSLPFSARADVMVHDPVAYETATGMTVGAALMGLHSSIDDTLIAASSPICDHVEIHSMKDDGGIMKMRKEESLALPADKIVKLEPMGYHLMLIGLKEPLKAGTEFPVTLTFTTGKPVTVTVPVQSRSELKKVLDAPHDAPMEHAH